MNLLKPQVILASLCFVASLVWLLSALFIPRPELAKVDLTFREETKSETVLLSYIEEDGTSRTVQTDLTVPLEPNARLELILEALKRGSDVWPDELELPTVFVMKSGNQVTAVLDFTVEAIPARSVTEEWQLLRSIEETLKKSGVDTMYVLRDGRYHPVFLDQVAVPKP